MTRATVAAALAAALLASAASAQQAEALGSRAERATAPPEIVEALRESFAQAPGAGKMRSPDEIFGTFGTDSLMRVQVTLEPSSEMLHARLDMTTEAGRAANRARIGALRDEVLADHEGFGVTVTARYQNFAAFGALVDETGLAALLADPRVRSIEPTRMAELHDTQGLTLMKGDAPRASYPGTNMTIAILDTGVDYNHPMLGGGGFPNAKVVSGTDTSLAGDADPIPVGNAHGTACAGITSGNITTVGDYNGGIAPDTRIAAVKVFPDNSGTTTFEDVAEGMDWCVTNMNAVPSHPIRVMSLSLGGGDYASVAACDGDFPTMLAAANAAVAAGITVLASSGNNGFCNSMGAPACLSPIISVGAVYDANLGSRGWCVASTTCFVGATSNPGCPGGLAAFDTTTAAKKVTAYSNSAPFLDVLAPSNNAYTTDITGPAGYSSGDYTTSFGGTSAACPYAAGAVAVLQHAHRTIQGRYLTPGEVRTYLTTTGEAVTDTKNGGLVPGRSTPLVDLTAALAAIPANQAPTDLDLSGLTVAENLAAGTTVGTLSTTDPDSGQTFTYTLLTAAPFEIVGDELRTTAILDFESTPSYTIQIRTDDNGFPVQSRTESFTISVLNMNEAPTDITLSLNAVEENAAPGTVVGALTVTDPDGAQPATFTLDSGDANFSIVATGPTTANLVTDVAFDFESAASYPIDIRVTDDASLAPPNLTFVKPFVIAVTDANDAPTALDLSSTSVAENSAVNTLVASLSTVDQDTAQTHTYSIEAGGAGLTISGNELRTTAVFNFEAASSIPVTLRTTDSGVPPRSFDRVLAITILDVNDPPVVDGASTLAMAVPYNGSTVLTSAMFSASDEDHGAEALKVRIVAQPVFGYIENTGLGDVVDGTEFFTVADIAAGLIRYVHTTGTPASDSFVLSVTDDTDTVNPAGTVNVSFFTTVSGWDVME